MRTALFVSAALHLAVGAVLAIYGPRSLAQWEASVARGETITLRASVAAEASAQPPVEMAMLPEEAVPTTSAPPELPPTPLMKQDAPPPITAPTTSAPTEPAPSPPPTPLARQPAPQAATTPAPEARVATQRVARAHELVVETSVVLPENAVSGEQVDELPRKLRLNPKPPYPNDALLRGIEGRVVLRVAIAADGQVQRVAIEDSSGVASFDQSALATVRTWRFTPARRRGAAVPYEVLVPVSFSIRG
jgi:protein TonB